MDQIRDSNQQANLLDMVDIYISPKAGGTLVPSGGKPSMNQTQIMNKTSYMSGG